MSQPEWTGPEADLISAELARVVLGGRGPDRPEQQFNLIGVFTRTALIHHLAMKPAMAAFNRAFQQLGEAVSRNKPV